MEQIMKRTMTILCVAGLMAPVLSAQDQEGATKRALEVATFAQAGGNLRVALETRVTSGKPYSAEAVNEFVQTLADGNRIVRRNSARVYRDSEGRTRREELGDSGGVAPKNGVTISDPVAGSSFILDATTRTAIKSPGMFARIDGAGAYTITRSAGAGEARITAETKIAAETAARAAATSVAVGGSGGRVMVAGPIGESSKEELGQQNIEGVTATGTRTTTVIPAGALGNEQPITIISEQWFSPDLDALVMTRHRDPRVGETTYRLINISRNEPDRSLFQVPSDYTIQERAPVLRRQQQ
jgi:hypothetical protein